MSGNKGKVRTSEMKRRYSLSKMGKLNPNFGKKSPNFKANAGYRALHLWIIRIAGQPTKCEKCDRDGLTGKQIGWASKDHKYLRELTNWIRLCSKCHGEYDKERGLRIRKYKKL